MKIGEITELNKLTGIARKIGVQYLCSSFPSTYSFILAKRYNWGDNFSHTLTTQEGTFSIIFWEECKEEEGRFIGFTR